jgi:hypothetical protein
VNSFTDAAIVAGITVGLTAGLGYLSSRFASRKAAAADSLVKGLQGGQRDRFLGDLGSPSHSGVISGPVQQWARAVRSSIVGLAREGVVAGSGDHPDGADIYAKWAEVLSWRMDEREARVRFAVTARAHDVKTYADFHRARDEESVRAGTKTGGPVPPDFDRTTDHLVAAVRSIRVPTLVRPVHRVARRTPGIRSRLADDDDLRMLVADYSVRATRSHLAARATAILEGSWHHGLQSTLPHPQRYPHRWLWDSCFNSIAWSSLGRAEALIELRSVLDSRLRVGPSKGFIPHMVYGDRDQTGGGVERGGPNGMSGYTQPPVYALAIDKLRSPPHKELWALVGAAREALDWLWRSRMHPSDELLVIVHPWESGADISPRFDGWYGGTDRVAESFDYREPLYRTLVDTTLFRESDNRVASSNSRGIVAASAFNAIAADAARRLAKAGSSPLWSWRSDRLSQAIDDKLWDEQEGVWVDRFYPESPASPDDEPAFSLVPTLDGVLGALGTRSKERAKRALAQCVGDGRFVAANGLSYLPKGHPLYKPDVYWRGPDWPQLNFLLVEAALKHGLKEIARDIARRTAYWVPQSGWCEYWNPEDGKGLGASGQSWSTLALPLYDTAVSLAAERP